MYLHIKEPHVILKQDIEGPHLKKLLAVEKVLGKGCMED